MTSRTKRGINASAMLFALILSGLAVVCSVATGRQRVGNVLPNAGFEIDENNDGCPDGWGRQYEASTLVTEDPQRGRRCLMVRNPGIPGSEVGATVPIEPSTRYVLSVYLRTRSPAGDEIGIAFRDEKNEGITSGPGHPLYFATSMAWQQITPSGEWQQLSVTFTSPVKAAYGYVFLRAQTPNSVVFHDNVSLVEATEETEESVAATAHVPADVHVDGISLDRNLLPNSGFEDQREGIPAGWTSELGNVVRSKGGRSGDYSVRIAWSPWGDDVAEKKRPVLRSEYIPYQGAALLASCWMRTNMEKHPDDSFNAACDVEFYDANREFMVTRRVASLNGITGWQYFERKIPCPQETGGLKVLFSFNKAGGQAWLDDVALNAIEGEEEHTY